jgi:hypothetical protein
MVTLRLRNNSPWAIAISADGDFTPATLSKITLPDGGKVFALPNDSQVEVCYEAEVIPTMSVDEYARVKVPNQPVPAYSCKWTAKRASGGNAWIQPGHSIIFSLPKDFLGRGLKVYTVFNYEWEADHGQLKANEPTHQVYLYSTDLMQ